MISEDGVLITPAKPLNTTELGLVELHKSLTECWRNRSINKVRVKPNKIFTDDDDIEGYSRLINEDIDLDAEFKSIMKDGDLSLIPDELIYTCNVNSFNNHVENHTSQNQKISARLKNMEMRENDCKTEEIEQVQNDKIEIDTLFNDGDEAVGDYKYSFCEEEEIDHENEYNL